jgi:hypothetical protein
MTAPCGKERATLRRSRVSGRDERLCQRGRSSLPPELSRSSAIVSSDTMALLDKRWDAGRCAPAFAGLFDAVAKRGTEGLIAETRHAPKKRLPRSAHETYAQAGRSSVRGGSIRARRKFDPALRPSARSVLREATWFRHRLDTMGSGTGFESSDLESTGPIISGVMDWKPLQRAQYIAYLVDERGQLFLEVADTVGLEEEIVASVWPLLLGNSRETLEDAL